MFRIGSSTSNMQFANERSADFVTRGAGTIGGAPLGVRLHPVLLNRAMWEQIPDDGARSLQALEIHCDDLDPPGDVDFADEMPERLKQPHRES